MSRRSLSALVLLLALCAAALFAPSDRPDGPGLPRPTSETSPETPPVGTAPEPPAPESPTADAPRPPPTTGTLTGTVLSREGRPIARARVAAAWHLEAEVVEGRYRIEGMPPGRHRVAAAAPGHPPAMREVRIEADVEAKLDFVLVPGGLPVAGRVTTADGQPLAGARVSAYPHGEGGPVFSSIDHPRTGPDGRFRIEGVPEGPVTVTAHAPLRASSSCRTAAGRTDLVLELVAAGEIHGTMVLPSPTPSAPPYRVRLLDSEGSEEAFLDSDEEPEHCDGLEFRFRGLAPGTWRLDALVRGVGRADLEKIRVEAGRVTRVKLEVSEGQSLAGRVVSAADGTPVSDALVVVAAQERWGPIILMMILDEESAWINGAFSARTDAEGRYRIVGLKPGTCSMAAVAAGFRPVARRGVKLLAPDAVPDLRLPAAAGLVVRLVGGDGKPEYDVDVIVNFDQESGSFDGTTDARGECRFDSVPPGRRHIQIDTTWARTVNVEVDVAAGKVTEVEVLMPASGTFVRGVVRRGGKPVGGRRVEAKFEDTVGRVFQLATQTDIEGRYRLDQLLPGPVWITVSERWSGPPNSVERVDTLRGENLHDIDLDAHRPVLVVVDAESGSPIPGASILVVRAYWAVANEEGRLVLPGSWEEMSDALVFAGGYGPAPLSAATGVSGDHRRIALRRSARLTLGLLDSRGRPVRSAVVEIREAGGADMAPFMRDWGDDFGDAQKGRYVYELAPGTYEIRVIHPDHATVERRVRLPAEGLRVDVVMP